MLHMHTCILSHTLMCSFQRNIEMKTMAAQDTNVEQSKADFLTALRGYHIFVFVSEIFARTNSISLT